MERLPDSLDGLAATTYGPLPDKGLAEVAAVYHTTETRGMPGYRGGDTAPHYTYDPSPRVFWYHADLARRVGTMRGSSTTGVHANEKSIQLEIIAYSDWSKSSGGLWVGDFTDEHYLDLAWFLQWCRTTNHHVSDAVTPTPPGGWLYGANSPYRLDEATWLNFGGLTCHGAVPGQTHWDTGVLDLERIANMAGGNDVDTARWASRLRPEDIHKYANIGVLNASEVDYWVGRLAQADWNNSEWNDLRDAAAVRGPIYGYPGQI